MGLVSLSLYMLLESRPVLLDALGALAIRLLMLVFSVFLISEARGFIAGRGVDEEMKRELLDAVRSVHGVESVNELIAVHSGSDRIWWS